MGPRWIVGIDGSSGARPALSWASAHADRLGVELVIVNIDKSDGAQVLSTDEVDDDRLLDRQRSLFKRSSHTGRSLLAAADGADLVIVGRHGTGGVWKNTIGSVGRYLVTHSTIPTVVVPFPREEVGDPQRIVVGFDGSDNACSAVEWAMAFASTASSISVVVALEVAPWLTDDVVQLRLEDELRAEKARLRELLDDIDPHGRLDREITIGGARPMLAAAAERADLVVLGQRGAGALTSLVVGSVSTWMLDASPAPVAIVPRAHGAGVTAAP